MAIVIDISTWTRPAPPTADVPAATPEDKARVIVEREQWDACKHASMAIDAKQRTVKCGTCGMWLDPVWCLQELFRYYQQRVDHRISAIQEFNEKEKARRERQEKRRAQPREHLRKRRAESLERAAYNEYQAKLLTIRADKQRATAAKIEQQLSDVEDAG